MCEIKRAKRLSQALVNFVTACAHLFTDNRMSSLPMRAKYRHCKTIWEQTSDNSPTVPNSSFFELMVVKTWCGDLAQLLDCLVCQFAVPFNAFLRMSLLRSNICTIFSDSSSFSDAPVKIRDSNVFLHSLTKPSSGLHSR